MSPLTLHCPAKVNLALSVGPPQPDGFHPIASWMVAVSFADTLTLRPPEPAAESLDLSIRFAGDAPQPQPIDWPLDRDLAFRAHAMLVEAAGRPLPLRAELIKRIPAGAGLGGGSSDAAAMLVGLDRFFSLGLGRERLISLANKLGSDVAFAVGALLGEPSAIATGRGADLTAAPLGAPLHLVLVLPPLRCPTAPVYRAFDQAAAASAAVRLDRVRALALGASPPPDDALFNDLADPACTVEPGIAQARDAVARAAARPAHVTGSGAAMFAVARDADDAEALAQRITRDAGLPAVATRTLDAAPPTP